MGRGKRANGRTPSGLRHGQRDYDAFWSARYDRARRAGMSTGMARLVANRELHHQRLEDKGLTPVGTGDIEALY